MRNALTTLRLTMLVSLGLVALVLLGLGTVWLLSASPSQIQRFLDDPLGSVIRSFARRTEVTVERIVIDADLIMVTDSGQTYTVKAGEDLYAVAIRFGVSPSDLRILNKLPTSEVTAGMVLKIPSGEWQSLSPPQAETDASKAGAVAETTSASGAVPDSGQTHTVKDGEDLYSVAIRVGVSPSDLRKWNNLESSALKPGMVLKISDIER